MMRRDRRRHRDVIYSKFKRNAVDPKCDIVLSRYKEFSKITKTGCNRQYHRDMEGSQRGVQNAFKTEDVERLEKKTMITNRVVYGFC